MPKDRFRRPTERTSGIANTTGIDMPKRPGLSGMSGPFRHWRKPVPFGLFRGSIPGHASFPFGQASFRGSLMLPMRRSKEMYRGRCFTGHVRLLQDSVRHAGRRPERGLTEERNSDAGIGGAAAARFPKNPSAPVQRSSAAGHRRRRKCIPGIASGFEPIAWRSRFRFAPLSVRPDPGARGVAAGVPSCLGDRVCRASSIACIPASMPLRHSVHAGISKRAVSFAAARASETTPLFPRIPSGIPGYPCSPLRFSG